MPKKNFSTVDWNSRIGQRFGRLVVLDFIVDHERNGKSVRMAICQCDCGKTTRHRYGNLSKGGTTSCGCYQREFSSERHKTHGKTKHITYTSWRAMISRCTCETDKAYPYYGGRGIKIDSKWEKFSGFLEDMGERPSKDYTIDRIDVNGDYCKENCKWATRKEQARNTRNNPLYEHDGVAKTLADWAETTGIKVGTLHDRLHKLNWSIRDALTKPLGKPNALQKSRSPNSESN